MKSNNKTGKKFASMKTKTRSAFFVLFLILAILFTGCSQSGNSITGSTSTPVPQPSPEPTVTPTPVSVITSTPSSTPGSSPPLKFKVNPLKSFFMPGEEVKIAIVFENAGSELLTLRPYPPEIKLVKYHPYSVAHVFDPGDGELKLMPGENTTYILKWNSDANLTPGFYYVEIECTGDYGSKEDWSVSTSLGRILIQYPQGAMEKDVDVNQTQIVNGVTVILEKVEMTSVGGKVYVLVQLPVTPQTSSSPSAPLPEPTPPPGKYTAVYRIDGSDEKHAYSPGLKWVDDRLRITWSIDPIPADTKEMTFVITEISEWKGPWEFRINLEGSV